MSQDLNTNTNENEQQNTENEQPAVKRHPLLAHLPETTISKTSAISVSVENPLKSSALGMISNEYNFNEYHLTTFPFGWKVIRSYKDFLWLDKHLRADFPFIYIPEFTFQNSGFLEEFLEKDIASKRLSSLELYLLQVMNTQELKYSQILQDFLSLDETRFTQLKSEKAQATPLIPPAHSIFLSKEEINIEGLDKMKDTQTEPEGHFNYLKMKEIAESNAPLFEKGKQICDEIVSLQTKLASLYKSLEGITLDVSHNYKKRPAYLLPDAMAKLENDMLSFAVCFSKWAEMSFQNSVNIERNVLPIFSFNSNEESGLDKVPKIVSKTRFLPLLRASCMSTK